MITEIFGLIGKGKSVLLTHLLHEFAFDKERNKQMRYAIYQKSAELGRELTVPPHCVSASYSCEFHKFGYFPRKNRIIDPSRLGLFDENSGIKPHYNFPYEVIGVDEAQRWFSGKGKGVPAWQKRWFEIHRHSHLEVFLATQRGINIDKDIRDLAQGIDVRKLEKTFDRNGNISRLRWTVNIIPEGGIDNYLNASADRSKCEYRTEIITAKYNVFKCYDSFSFKSKFDEGHEGQDFDLDYGETS